MIQRWCMVPAAASDDEMAWLGARAWSPRDLLPGNLRLGLAEFDDQDWEKINATTPAAILPSLTAPASAAPAGLQAALDAHGVKLGPSDDIQQALRKLRDARGGKFFVDKPF